LENVLEKRFTYAVDVAEGEPTMSRKSGVQHVVMGLQQPLGDILGKLKTSTEKGYAKNRYYYSSPYQF
jgi:hypothetical protein